MKIEHVALAVQDLEQAKAFFCTYLEATSNTGYQNPVTSFRSYFLTFDDGTRLELIHQEGQVDCEKPLPRTGYVHIAFSLGSKEKVDLLTKRLKDDGYTIFRGPRTTGDGYYESCVVDFEGNLIELTV